MNGGKNMKGSKEHSKIAVYSWKDRIRKSGTDRYFVVKFQNNEEKINYLIDFSIKFKDDRLKWYERTNTIKDLLDILKKNYSFEQGEIFQRSIYTMEGTGDCDDQLICIIQGIPLFWEKDGVHIEIITVGIRVAEHVTTRIHLIKDGSFKILDALPFQWPNGIKVFSSRFLSIREKDELWKR